MWANVLGVLAQALDQVWIVKIHVLTSLVHNDVAPNGCVGVANLTKVEPACKFLIVVYIGSFNEQVHAFIEFLEGDHGDVMQAHFFLMIKMYAEKPAKLFHTSFACKIPENQFQTNVMIQVFVSR